MGIGGRLIVYYSGGGYVTCGGLIVVDIDSLQLHIIISVVVTCLVDAVLIGDDFPELKQYNK